MKQILHTYFFDSSSGDKKYQTLYYTDGTTSCECPGWTRRVQPDGSRTCKHVRLVEAGLAEPNRSFGQPKPATRPIQFKTKGKVEPQEKSRIFQFD